MIKQRNYSGTDQRKRNRRKMRSLKIGEVSNVTVPAQETALASIRKSDDDDEIPVTDNEYSKAGDVVDAVTSSTDGHQHGISLSDNYEGGYRMTVHYAGGAAGESHDHQIIRTAEGTFTISENFGHTHDLDSDAIMSLIMEMLMKSADDFDAESPEREVREEQAAAGVAMKDGTLWHIN